MPTSKIKRVKGWIPIIDGKPYIPFGDDEVPFLLKRPVKTDWHYDFIFSRATITYSLPPKKK